MASRKALLSQNLLRLMSSRGMTVADLSRALGISYTTISDWLKGKTYPRDEKLQMIADYFNVDCDCLRTGRIRKIRGNHEYVSKYLEDVPQVNQFIMLLDAYQDADEPTRRAVDALLQLPHADLRNTL